MPNIKKKIERLNNYDKDGNLAMFEEIQELADNTEEIAKIFKGVKVSDIEKIKGEKGDKGDSIKGDKGDKGDAIKGDKGDNPTNKELLNIIKPLIPEPIKGRDGEDADIESIIKDVFEKIPEVNKQEIVDLVVEQIPTSGEAIRDSLELLQGDERLDVTAIKGLNKILEEIQKKNIDQGKAFGTGPANLVQYADLTGQCDGSTKEFQVPLHRKVVMLTGTQFPLIYRPTTDFTTANYTLKLTSEVNAPDTGQTLIFQYIK